MSAQSVVIWIVVGVVGVVAGFLAGQIVKGYGLGLVGNLLVGIVGAFLASLLLPAPGVGFSLGAAIITRIACATIGTIVLLLLIGLVRRTA
jgi:uncharacterized membrane protein YeaQ/YmgE (transglycosylase-associated protein family)